MVFHPRTHNVAASIPLALPPPLVHRKHAPVLRFDTCSYAESVGPYGPHQDLHGCFRPCLNRQDRVSLIPLGPSMMLFSELPPLLLGDGVVPCVGWAWLSPNQAVAYGPCMCISARTMQWFILTAMRPGNNLDPGHRHAARDQDKVYHRPLMGMRSRSSMPTLWGRPGTPSFLSGLGTSSTAAILVEVAQQYQRRGVPLHHVLEPVQDLSLQPVRGGVHHPNSDKSSRGTSLSR